MARTPFQLRSAGWVLAAAALVGAAAARPLVRWFDPFFQMTLNDFHLPGTQVGEVPPQTIGDSTQCSVCHGDYDEVNDPYATWKGSLMGLAGRDPLFFAQMSLANQDVTNVGYYCLRCHVPMSFTTGHAYDPSGASLDATDLDGVNCHFCHSMVDPIYRPGISPAEDQAILANLLDGPPAFYGNAMFVLDPTGQRRGPRADSSPPHTLLQSEFFKSGNFCGTCHDVGNIAVSRQPNGTYRYNSLDAPTPNLDPAHQFPLERTYTEWKLSQFATTGVDMGGRFGGTGGPVVASCQDCHMPKTSARACFFGPVRPDAARHEFAGAAAQVLDLILAQWGDTSFVDPAAIAQGRQRAVSMLERAASLTVTQSHQVLRVRVTNESGHKLPTGHIEGRRVWVNVKFLDAQGAIVGERGRYDAAEASLETATTTVYEMHVGLSEDASLLTGLVAGATSHMALADTIVKDNRIPPRGFTNSAYAAGGAPVVGHNYADGQYWDDLAFPIPAPATRAEVSVFYQNTPREYIDHLRDANVTDQNGEVLHSLWVATGRGAPIPMAQQTLTLGPVCPGDWDGNGQIGVPDVAAFVADWYAAIHTAAMGTDLSGNGRTEPADVALFINEWMAAYQSGC